MENSPQTLGTLLRTCRTKAKFSQRHLAERSGVPYTLISALENGKRTAGTLVAEKLATALKLTGENRARFLDLAKLTSRKIRLSVAEEKGKEVPSAWLKFLKFLVPEWEIKEVTFPKSGVYDALITREDLWTCGVIFRPRLTVLVWNPGLEGALANTQPLRDLVEEATMQGTTTGYRSVTTKARALGYEMRLFGDLLKKM